MDDTNSSSPVGGPTPLPFGQRYLGVFVRPGEVFADIARNPDFMKPLLVLVAVSLTVTQTMLAKVGMHRILYDALMHSGRASNLSPEQISNIVGKSVALATIIAQLGSLFGVPVFLLAVAGVGLILLNGVFGIHASFTKVFSVACYADLPSVLGGLLAIAVMLFGNPDHFNPHSPGPSNPGFFLNPATASRPVMALASSLDIFVLWFLVLLAMGLSRVAEGKVKSRTIFALFLGLWVLLVAVKVAFALIA